MSAICPACLRRQYAGLLCSACCDRLERDLGDVASIVDDLAITLSKQARIGAVTGSAGLARERSPIHFGAVEAGDVLANVLGTWVIDVCGEDWPFGPQPSAKTFAADLLSHINEIRRHPAVDELMDQVTDAINQARHAIDRPANRTVIFVGPCPEMDENGDHCPGEVYAFIPTEDDRPARMECGADKVHRWSSIQFYRAGKRIADRQAEIRDRSA